MGVILTPHQVRSRKAHAVRYGHLVDQAELDRELRAAQLKKAIEVAVAAAPPITTEQRRELAAILVPAGVA